MKNISSALWAESLKILRSKILWATILFYLFIPFMIGILLFVQKYPEIASKLGMIGTKAAMLRFGDLDWQNYFGLLNQLIAAVGLIGFAFVTSWVFGREYSDRTIGDLLALPTPRSSIVVSKFIAIFFWCFLLSIILFSFGLLIGEIIQVSGWSKELAFDNFLIFIITSFMVILLCPTFAFFASYGRGYLLPIGFAILTLIVAQFIGLVGLGPYFPWAIPGLYSVATGNEIIPLEMISYVILFSTSILGFIATLLWWVYADQY